MHASVHPDLTVTHRLGALTTVFCCVRADVDRHGLRAVGFVVRCAFAIFTRSRSIICSRVSRTPSPAQSTAALPFSAHTACLLLPQADVTRTKASRHRRQCLQVLQGLPQQQRCCMDNRAGVLCHGAFAEQAPTGTSNRLRRGHAPAGLHQLRVLLQHPCGGALQPSSPYRPQDSCC